MKAMVLKRIANLAENPRPLSYADVPNPEPGAGEVLLKIAVCGVCHTELDEIEGRTPPQLPVILGHQAVGRVVAVGSRVETIKIGARVGVAWIFSACGDCRFCRSGYENLCAGFTATGRDVNGGYAELMTVPEGFVHPIPDVFGDAEAAPLLCAGAIGYRALRLTGIQDGDRLGLTGFGASGHLVLKMARQQFPRSEIFVFARNAEERRFALDLGASWAGGSDETPPAALRAIIDTTPVWMPVVKALEHLEAGGRLVINAIRKEDDRRSLLQIDYARHLWREKEIKTVANITRRDVSEFLALAALMQLKPDIQTFPLIDANRALNELKSGRIRGAKVLLVSD